MFVDGRPYLTGSPIRLERASGLTTELLHSKKENDGITAKKLREKVFSDNFNAPQAIACQEDPSRPIESRSSTLFNIVMRFKEGEKPWAEVVWGTPGSGDEGPVLKMPW